MTPREKPTKKEAGPSRSASDAAARLASIVEAAERAAASVIDDAEEEAQRRLEEADDRANRIVAERLRAIADELDPPAPIERSTPHLAPVDDAAADGDDELARRRAGAAGARLLATEMAISGASRKEIDTKLRKEFEIEDTDGILDAILGPEG